MKRDHKKISRTAFNHIIFRTFYGIPFAEEFMKAAKKYSPPGYLFENDIQRKISPIFEGRYRGGEQALERFIKRNPNCTVLELAGGFSLHGVNLAGKYPRIKYIETDLPDMIKLKKKIIAEIGANRPNLSFKTANALSFATLKKIIAGQKNGFRIAIYCEGLLNYFDDMEKIMIAENMKRILQKYGGVWITSDPALSSEAMATLKKFWPGYRQAVGKIEKIAKQKYDSYGFKSERETDRFFRECGFAIQKQIWPMGLKSFRTVGFNARKKDELKNILKKFGKVWILSIR